MSGIELGDKKLLATPITYDDLEVDEKQEDRPADAAQQPDGDAGKKESPASLSQKCVSDSHTIYIANLPHDMTELGLSQFFHSRHLGKVEYMKLTNGAPVPTDLFPKYAFVELESPLMAQKAVKELNKINFDGDTVHVMPSRDDWIDKQNQHLHHNAAMTDKMTSSMVSSDNPLYAGLSEEALRRKLEEMKKEKELLEGTSLGRAQSKRSTRTPRSRSRSRHAHHRHHKRSRSRSSSGHRHYHQRGSRDRDDADRHPHRADHRHSRDRHRY